MPRAKAQITLFRDVPLSGVDPSFVDSSGMEIDIRRLRPNLDSLPGHDVTLLTFRWRECSEQLAVETVKSTITENRDYILRL